MKKQSNSLKAILSAIFLIVFVGVFLLWREKSGTSWVNPRVGSVVEAVYGLGTVIATRNFQVKSAVPQAVRKVFVKEGDLVREKDPLVQFDDSGISRAPFAGTVSAIYLKEGELVTPQGVILTVTNLEDLYLEISLEQQSVLRVQKNQKAQISFESLRNERFQGTVRSLFPRDNQFIVRIDLDKFPAGVLPGMTADVAIEVGRKENALSVPLSAVSAGKVSVLRDNKVVKVPVQLGVVDGEWAEIKSDNIQLTDQISVRQK